MSCARRLGPVGQVLRDFLLAWKPASAASPRWRWAFAKRWDDFAVCRIGRGRRPLLLRATQRLQEPPTTDEAEPQRAAQTGRIAAAASLLLRLSETYGRRAASDARLFAEGLRKLALHPLVEAAADIELVDLHLALVARDDGLGLPAWLAAIDRLARPTAHCGIVLPSVDDRPPLQRALKPIFDSIYQRHELAIELSESGSLGPFAEGTTPWSRLIRSLFRPKKWRLARVSFGTCRSGDVDAIRWPTGRSACRCCPRAKSSARRCCGSGHCRRGRISRAQATVDRSAASGRRSHHPFQVASLARRPAPPSCHRRCGSFVFVWPVLKLGLPREGFVQLLTSRYVRFPGPLGTSRGSSHRLCAPPGSERSAIPSAAVRRREICGESARGSEPTWDFAGCGPGSPPSKKPASDDKPRSWPPHLPHLVEQVEQALHELTSLPSQATIADHCRAPCAAASAPALFERCTTPPLPEESEAESATLCMQLRCPSARFCLRRRALSVSRRATEVGGTTWTSDAGYRTARVCPAVAHDARVDCGTKWPRRRNRMQSASVNWQKLPPFAHLFIAGLIDGELPTFRPEDSLFARRRPTPARSFCRSTDVAACVATERRRTAEAGGRPGARRTRPLVLAACRRRRPPAAALAVSRRNLFCRGDSRRQAQATARSASDDTSHRALATRAPTSKPVFSAFATRARTGQSPDFDFAHRRTAQSLFPPPSPTQTPQTYIVIRLSVACSTTA